MLLKYLNNISRSAGRREEITSVPTRELVRPGPARARGCLKTPDAELPCAYDTLYLIHPKKFENHNHLGKLFTKLNTSVKVHCFNSDVKPDEKRMVAPTSPRRSERSREPNRPLTTAVGDYHPLP